MTTQEYETRIAQLEDLAISACLICRTIPLLANGGIGDPLKSIVIRQADKAVKEAVVLIPEKAIILTL